MPKRWKPWRPICAPMAAIRKRWSRVSIDMSPAFIKGVTEQLPNAEITFDKFHIIQHASNAVSDTRRAEQKIDPSLKGMRWKLLKRRDNLKPEDKADLDELLKNVTTKRTARAWVYQDQ